MSLLLVFISSTVHLCIPSLLSVFFYVVHSFVLLSTITVCIAFCRYLLCLVFLYWALLVFLFVLRVVCGVCFLLFCSLIIFVCLAFPLSGLSLPLPAIVLALHLLACSDLCLSVCIYCMLFCLYVFLCAFLFTISFSLLLPSLPYLPFCVVLVVFMLRCMFVVCVLYVCVFVICSSMLFYVCVCVVMLCCHCILF